MIVKHNITAMNSNRMLGLTTSAQAKSTEKLSSGYKINRAADDAAGLAISEKMRRQVRGLTQASANAQDGISAVQTAEGALNEVQDMLQRMNELSVKAANGTQSASDRDAIQSEIDQLVTEIDRVSETTKFNETYLLKGDRNADKDTNFKYKEVESIKQDLYYVEGSEVKTLAKGTYKDAVDTTKTYYSNNIGKKVGTAIAASDLTASTVVSAAGLYQSDSNGNYYEVAVGTATNGNAYYTVANSTAAIPTMATVAVAGSTGTGYFAGQDMYDSAGAKVASGTYVGTANTVSSNYFLSMGTKNLTAGADSVDPTDSKYTEKNIVQFVDKDGNEIAANGLDRYITNDGQLKADADLWVKIGEGVVDRRKANQTDVDQFVDATDKFEVGALTLSLHVGADATKNNQISVDLKSMSAKTLGLKGLKVNGDDDTNALNAVETIKAALEKVSSQRSDLGAIQNRLEHTISNLDNVVENTQSAEAQIRDTDIAKEMVQYANNNILQQAGTSMLSQANQSNQLALSLLG